MTIKTPSILDTCKPVLKVAQCGNGEAVLFNIENRTSLGTFASVADAQTAAKKADQTTTKNGATLTRRKAEG